MGVLVRTQLDVPVVLREALYDHVGEVRMQKWCSVHKTTSHSDANCYVQGAPRAQTGISWRAHGGRAKRPNTPRRHGQDAHSQIRRRFQQWLSVLVLELKPPDHPNRGLWSNIAVGLWSIISTRGRRNDGSRDHCKEALEMAGMTPSGIGTAVIAGTVRVPGCHSNSSVGSPERCLSASGHNNIIRDCRGRTSSGTCHTIYHLGLMRLLSIIIVRTARTTLLGLLEHLRL